MSVNTSTVEESPLEAKRRDAIDSLKLIVEMLPRVHRLAVKYHVEKIEEVIGSVHIDFSDRRKTSLGIQNKDDEPKKAQEPAVPTPARDPRLTKKRY